jgi:hypothetical protein
MAGFSWAGLDRAYTEKMTELKEERRRQEDIAANRENALFELALVSSKESSKYKQTGEYRKAAEAARSLEVQLDELDNLDEETLKFYKPVLEDPFAALEVQNFIKGQNDQGININLTDVPNLMLIVSSKAPLTEKLDYLELITGKDFSGREGEKLYRDLAIQISSMSSVPGRTAFVVPKQGTQVDRAKQTQRQENMVNIIGVQIVPMATREIMQNPNTQDPRIVRIVAALDKVNNGGKEDRMLGLQTLMEEYLKAPELKYLIETFPDEFRDYQKNPYIPINITSMPLEL